MRLRQTAKRAVPEIIEHSAKLKMRDIANGVPLSQIDLYRTALKMPAREFDAMFKELNEFFAEIKQEAAEFAESFRSNPRSAEAHMDDIKNRTFGEGVGYVRN